jgi:proteasome lid subunit RPN8/RPN11
VDVSTETTNKPDASDIDRDTLTVRPTAALTNADGFAVVVPKSAWDQMHQHAHVRLDVEVGGVLVGKTFATEAGEPYLLIEAIIPAVAAESRETNITFTAEAWTRIHEVIDRDHPGGMIVGWYHTHPAFGVFLSEMDVFICRHFFDLPHQVAIVIDPVAKTHGCFIWRRGVPTEGTMAIEGGAALSAAATPRQPVANVPLAAPEPERWIEPNRRSLLKRFIAATLHPISRLDRSQWFALLFLLVIAILLFGTLAMLWLSLSPAELLERIRLFADRFTTGGKHS